MNDELLERINRHYKDLAADPRDPLCLEGLRNLRYEPTAAPEPRLANPEAKYEITGQEHQLLTAAKQYYVAMCIAESKGLGYLRKEAKRALHGAMVVWFEKQGRHERLADWEPKEASKIVLPGFDSAACERGGGTEIP